MMPRIESASSGDSALHVAAQLGRRCQVRPTHRAKAGTTAAKSAAFATSAASQSRMKSPNIRLGALVAPVWRVKLSIPPSSWTVFGEARIVVRLASAAQASA
jgi:hypothetical protein